MIHSDTKLTHVASLCHVSFREDCVSNGQGGSLLPPDPGTTEIERNTSVESQLLRRLLRIFFFGSCLQSFRYWISLRCHHLSSRFGKEKSSCGKSLIISDRSEVIVDAKSTAFSVCSYGDLGSWACWISTSIYCIIYCICLFKVTCVTFPCWKLFLTWDKRRFFKPSFFRTLAHMWWWQGEHAHLLAEARSHVAAMQCTAERMDQSAEMMTLAVMTQAQCVWMYLFGRFSLPGPRDHDATGTTQIECHASIKIDWPVKVNIVI